MVALIGVHLGVDSRPRGGAGGSRQPGGGDHPGSGGRGLDEFAAMQMLRHRYPPSTDIPRIRGDCQATIARWSVLSNGKSRGWWWKQPAGRAGARGNTLICLHPAKWSWLDRRLFDRRSREWPVSALNVRATRYASARR
jgi:hypothetical protein